MLSDYKTFKLCVDTFCKKRKETFCKNVFGKQSWKFSVFIIYVSFSGSEKKYFLSLMFLNSLEIVSIVLWAIKKNILYLFLSTSLKKKIQTKTKLQTNFEEIQFCDIYFCALILKKKKQIALIVKIFLLCLLFEKNHFYFMYGQSLLLKEKKKRKIWKMLEKEVLAFLFYYTIYLS